MIEQTQTSPAAEPQNPVRKSNRVTQAIARFGLLIAWAAVFLIFSVLPKTADIFPTIDNLATILGSQAVIAVLTLALVIPLITGDYDLSVAYTLTLSAMLIAVLNVQHGWPILAAVAVAAVGLGLEQHRGEPLIGPFLGAGAIGELR